MGMFDDLIPKAAPAPTGGQGVHPLERAFREHFVAQMGKSQNRVEDMLHTGGRRRPLALDVEQGAQGSR